MNLERTQLRDFMCGSLLGDGSLYIPKGMVNAVYREGHSKKQKEYILWKRRVLERNLDVRFLYSESPHPIYDSLTCRIDSTSSLFFTKLHRTFYDANGVKLIPKWYVERYFGKIGLAVFFMDDGSVEWRNGRVKQCDFSTYCFEEGDVIWFCEFLHKRFGIFANPSLNKKRHRIRLYGESARILIDIIRPVVFKVPCMTYKVDYEVYASNRY